MKHIFRIFFFLLLAALVVAAVTFFLQPEPIPVRTAPVERGSIESTVVNTRAGTVKVCRRAGLSPSIGGQISTWPVSEGMKVQKGDLLLSLWNEDLQAQLQLAQSEEKATRLNSQAVCLQADIAERLYERYLPLRETGAATEEKLDNLATESRIASAQCSSARAALEVSRNRISLASANLARTFLYAPFDGIIAQLNGELGEYVTPSPVGVQTLPAVDLLDTGCYYVSAPIDEVDAASIRKGMKARISLDAFRELTFEGRVQRIADFVLDFEKQSRTVEIEVIFDNPADTNHLLPGYSADTEILLDTRQNILRIPSEAIMNKTRVYVFDPSEKILRQRHITTGLSNWDYTEVLSGLKVGEKIVLTTDRKGVEDGAPAKVETDDHE